MSNLIDDLARAVTEEEEYLTIRQFAKIFQLHPTTVSKWIVEGRIGHFRLGKTGGKGDRVRIPRSEVVRLAMKNYRAAVDDE